MKPDSVSVVVPAYQAAAHLPACLEAIAASQFRPAEVIVVEDGGEHLGPQESRGVGLVTASGVFDLARAIGRAHAREMFVERCGREDPGARNRDAGARERGETSGLAAGLRRILHSAELAQAHPQALSGSRLRRAHFVSSLLIPRP